jgi:hypothetical protein
VRGATNLQRQLTVLADRHRVTLSSPRHVPKTALPNQDKLILEGVASSDKIDCDRVRFQPFCFSSLPELPLLIEHDAARPVGTAVLTYDAAGGLRVRTSPLAGEARTYSAFSIAVRDISYDLCDIERRSFYAQITSAELTECSLSEYPHNGAALVLNRMRGSAQAEFYGAAQQYFAKLTEIVALIQKGRQNVTSPS